MQAQELREKFLKFFQEKGHTIIPSASLIPENDPSVFFTNAGMHPLVPYLLGEKHPGGERVANVQKCIRTGDIDEVGDNRHLTFFEMLGNWSFGNYFKEDAIKWSFEFLTDKKVGLGLDPKRLYITVFKGEDGISRDEKAIQVWHDVFKDAGIDVEVAKEDSIIENNIRIIPLGKDDNFWIAGEFGVCGGDTEMFYDTRPEEGLIKGKFSELVDSFRLIEIWNDVFMEYDRPKVRYKDNQEYIKLKQKNVDTGMGLERTLAVIEGRENVFETELFEPIIKKIEEISGKKYKDNQKSFRIIADHLKAAVMIISDGATPSNLKEGYILRRLIRRAIRHGKILGIENNFTKQIGEVVVKIYEDVYLNVKNENIFIELEKEENKFRKTLENGLKKLKEYVEKKENDPMSNFAHRDRPDFGAKNIDFINLIPGKDAFDLYQTYGFPPELINEELAQYGMGYHKEEFKEEFKKHQKLSQTASIGMFKGGLADTGENTTKLHTAAHLLLAAIRKTLGADIIQKGANITAERLRFDFNYPEKLNPEQIAEIEKLVNQKIEEKIPVEMNEMLKTEALKLTKSSFDSSKYGDVVKVYKIGDFSIELCGGPHVTNTSELGKFKIKKEESSSAGVRRIKAILE